MTEPAFAPCPLCRQYSHSIGEDQLTAAFQHFESMYSHRGDGTPTQHMFDEATRDAAQVLMAAAAPRPRPVMTDVVVTQEDEGMAARFIAESDGDFPELAGLFAQQRIKAALAMQERAAAWLEGADGKIPGLSAFAPVVSGNNMPDMSGDDRNRLNTFQRRQFDRAMASVANAIRNLEVPE